MEGKYPPRKDDISMLINSTIVYECEVDIVLLTKSTEAYLAKINDGVYYLYIADIKNPRHIPEKIREFSTKDEAITFIHEFWSKRPIVVKYMESFKETEFKPATERQIKTTKGSATTYGETTWFFAKSRCQTRLHPVIYHLKNGIPTASINVVTELDKLKNPEVNQ